jgi:hypothetical protein
MHLNFLRNGTVVATTTATSATAQAASAGSGDRSRQDVMFGDWHVSAGAVFWTLHNQSTRERFSAHVSASCAAAAPLAPNKHSLAVLVTAAHQCVRQAAKDASGRGNAGPDAGLLVAELSVSTGGRSVFRRRYAYEASAHCHRSPHTCVTYWSTCTIAGEGEDTCSEEYQLKLIEKLRRRQRWTAHHHEQHHPV